MGENNRGLTLEMAPRTAADRGRHGGEQQRADPGDGPQNSSRQSQVEVPGHDLTHQTAQKTLNKGMNLVSILCNVGCGKVHSCSARLSGASPKFALKQSQCVCLASEKWVTLFLLSHSQCRMSCGVWVSTFAFPACPQGLTGESSTTTTTTTIMYLLSTVHVGCGSALCFPRLPPRLDRGVHFPSGLPLDALVHGISGNLSLGFCGYKHWKDICTCLSPETNTGKTNSLVCLHCLTHLTQLFMTGLPCQASCAEQCVAKGHPQQEMSHKSVSV